MLEYFFAIISANGWVNIEDDEHQFYWVKGKSSLYALVFNNKLQNQLIVYFQGQKRNYISRIIKLK